MSNPLQIFTLDLLHDDFVQHQTLMSFQLLHSTSITKLAANQIHMYFLLDIHSNVRRILLVLLGLNQWPSAWKFTSSATACKYTTSRENATTLNKGT
jgi:hypothetical protein